MNCKARAIQFFSDGFDRQKLLRIKAFNFYFFFVREVYYLIHKHMIHHSVKKVKGVN